MSKQTNPFAIFANNEVKTAKIKALGGAEIKYRELTMAENDAFTKRIIKEFNGDTPDIDLEAANEVKYEKVAAMLIEPKMSVEELKQLSIGAADAINEIAALGEADVEEGN